MDPSKATVVSAIIGALAIIIVAIIGILKTCDGTPVPDPQNNIVQMIDFNYDDSPIKHGWHFFDGVNQSQVVFKPIFENKKIRGVEATSPNEWGMEIDLKPAAKQYGKILEFNIVPQQDAAIYAYIIVTNSNGSNNTGWLKFMFCREDVEPVIRDGKGDDEWRVCLTSVSHKGNWLLFRANLIEEAKKTFSQDGWSFISINKIRIRGNLSLDYISLKEIG